jgi:predicted secreted protein
MFVAHCILNQNAKIDRCARYPGTIRELAEYLIESDIGIVQMPCPELLALGLDRKAETSVTASVESEDTRVALRMNDSGAVEICARIAADVVYQVQEYARNGFEVTGILAINGSPTCGVETNWREDEEVPGPGVFIRCLHDRMQSNRISVPFRGIKAVDPQQAVTAARELASPKKT